MKTRATIFSIAMIMLVSFSACDQKKSGDKKVATLNSTKTDLKKTKDQVVNVINSLPTQQETARLINETGASYIAGLTSEQLQTDQLLTRAQKSKSFGAVLFDLAYTDIYNQPESFSKLLKIQEDLTRDLGYEELLKIQKPYHERFQANKNIRDSVDAIVSEMMRTTNDYIQKNGSASDISLIFASTLVKALNITSTVTLFARTNDKLVELIWNQKEHVNAAFSILEMTSEDPEVAEMKDLMKPVNEVFMTSNQFTLDEVDKINQLTSRIIG